MLDNSKTTNIQLTDTQTAQLEEFQLRLANISSEISNSAKVLKGIKSECDRVVQERAYQEEILDSLKKEIEKLQETKTEVYASVNFQKAVLEETEKLTTKLKDANLLAMAELEERSKKVNLDEENLHRSIEDFNIKSSQLLEDQLSIKTAKDAFAKATETVKW